ncbi:MAG: diaminohydroxyphosphoribosylaminopyrimidine deaminase [Actinomycetota bacterium]|nr:diaminohydroxyphosphoribosylaminopyrimidine deaminase [Actinomycetota bacterium]
MHDDELMARALELGRQVRRLTAPNPWVGSVVASDGVVVGEGATRPPGGPHAEVVALAAAGDRARGATLFTTLEPCSHRGQTAPCVDALIAAGVARVVSAIDDPDSHVSGRGHAALRAAGIAVDVGTGARESTTLLAPYVVHRREGRSFVLLKAATSLDGRVAAADGGSRWITGPAARADAHERRADSQAIVVGSGTALADAPTLTVRDATPPFGPPPLRVLVDGRGRVPATGPLFDPSLAPTLVVTTDRAPMAMRDAWAAAGAAVEVVDGPGSTVDLSAMLTMLASRGVLQALVEGGPGLHGALLNADLVDGIVAYVAPVILGAGGRAAYGLDPGPPFALAPRYRLTRVAPLGDDVCLEYEPRDRS